ncbi:hypothetical protein SASPL_150555 [Salvia splendens]|uniref:Protein TIFY n=1 Tax=Salvia splendens TaxID=180675 RepID=A0A8X8W6S4_SALSN|nr:protein TIFY 10A-like [Salvia splendens]XP_042034707.1 protein TIFY 10A-like [Salvia splendens]KAG6389095.1 hypothetical protein SASPL_150554 [Salvia splendens]KAG6389096.1 hypothetical protein SASPL_150555 [Salvia splendens]
MASSGKLDSAKFHGRRSNLSQTCNLLSQYLKENGRFGDLDLNFTPKGSVNQSQPEKEVEQMTIFYAGQVIVLNDIPAGKAKEIINLAAAVSPIQKPQLPPLGSDLPIARKNSLARFLEKRKDRITAAAPYQASKPAVKEEPWLEMGSLSIPSRFRANRVSDSSNLYSQCSVVLGLYDCRSDK